MNDIFTDIFNLKKNNQPLVLVTVIDKHGEGPQVIGSKMIVSKDGAVKGTVGGGALESCAIQKSCDIFSTQKSELCSFDLSGGSANQIEYKTGMICGGVITLFFDYLASYQSAFIFGAGHVGKAVINHLKSLQYTITAVDHREGIFEGYDDNIKTMAGNYSEVISHLHISDDAYIIIATYGHEYDYEVLDSLYKKPCNPAYIGLLSSKVKAKHTIGIFKDKKGAQISLKNLYTPAGLDIGGSTPDEIAISIISQMQAVRYNKNGHNHLREEWYLSK